MVFAVSALKNTNAKIFSVKNISVTPHSVYQFILYFISSKQNGFSFFVLMCFWYFSKVESLKKLCQTRKEKIQECQQKIEEAWSIAKEEAEKGQVAKEAIKVLTSRVNMILSTKIIQF